MALLNLITISSTWARVIDVMDSEVSILLWALTVYKWELFLVHYLILSQIQSGSRLFGFIGAGATLGQLFGSLFATVMAWMGPCMLFRTLKCLLYCLCNFIFAFYKFHHFRFAPFLFSPYGIGCTVVKKDKHGHILYF